MDQSERVSTSSDFLPVSTENLEFVANLSAEQLDSESQHIQNQLGHLREETERLAYANYRTFISAANCSRKIHNDIASIESTVSKVVDLVPQLMLQVDDFQKCADQEKLAHQSYQLALKKKKEMTDLLEMPLRMEKAVSSENWEAVLELSERQANLFKRLSIRHEISNPIAQANKAVQRIRESMRIKLIDKLHKKLSLPECLQCVHQLRSLGIYSDAQLRVVFLSARHAWLQEKRAEYPIKTHGDNTDTEFHRTFNLCLENTRLHLFDICTEYRAAFGMEGTPTYDLRLNSENLNTAYLFSFWMLEEATSIRDQILTSLHDTEGLDIRNILAALANNLTTFCKSFALVSSDMRVFFADIIRQFFIETFESVVIKAKLKVTAILQNKDWKNSIGVPKEFNKQAMIDDNDQSNFVKSMQTCLPLAHFYNDIVQLLNSCRQSIPLSATPNMVASINQALREVIALVVSKGSDSLHACYLAMLIMLHLVPALNRALINYFDLQYISTRLGYHHTQLDLIQKCLQLDENLFVEMRQQNFIYSVPDVKEQQISIETENGVNDTF